MIFRTKLLLLFLSICIIYTVEGKKKTARITCSNMQVEGQTGWIVTDEPIPRFSWDLITTEGGRDVEGYEVIAASSQLNAEKGEGDLWNSKILPVEKGPWVLFDASKLASRTQVWWSVRPVFSDNEVGEWSDISSFEVGLKDSEDWKATWIAMNKDSRKRSAPLFCKSFTLTKPVAKARLYVCGLGYHESWMNGSKLGDAVLEPAQTDYEIRSFYVSHDVTKFIKKKQNTLGFWLGDGFYNQDLAFRKNSLTYGQPRIIAQLEITHEDGSVTVIKTDESWKCSTSAVWGANVYAGENYDARLFDANWATNKADVSNWESVVKIKSPGGKLIAQQLPPCRRLDTVKVKSVDELRPGTWIFDFGQNLVGWEKLRVNATPGTVITMRFAENRLPDGELGFASSGVKATKVIQTDTFICKGNGVEIWEPRFTYHGFQFAEVTVSNGALKNKVPGKDFLEGIVVYTDMGIVGEFESSDATLNSLFDLAHWTQTGGIQGVPTDCPIRERCGWTGDAHNVVPYTMNRFNAAAMWRKYTDDIVTKAQVSKKMLCFGDEFGERTVQLKMPGIPTMIAPGKRFIGEGSADWGSAVAFIPWDIYVRTGDSRSLFKHYASIRLWADHLKGLSTDGIVYSGMGDWCRPVLEDVGRTKDRELYGNITPMLSTACYHRSVRITAEVAKMMGNEVDYKYYDALAKEIRNAYTKAFFSENPQMVPDQSMNAIAVNWNVLAPEKHKEVADKLAQQVKDADFHFMTGVFGMPSLWPVLLKYGYQETAWKAIQSEADPGFKYLLKRGATTFWEVWPSKRDEGQEYVRSMSHPFQGGFVAWFYEGLAGISPDTDHPGYTQFNLAPQLIDGLDWVKCNYKSPMGAIESSWKREGGNLIWDVKIPVGAKANLRIPGEVTEILGASNDALQSVEKISDYQGKASGIVLNSGTYTIKSILK